MDALKRSYPARLGLQPVDWDIPSAMCAFLAYCMPSPGPGRMAPISISCAH